MLPGQGSKANGASVVGEIGDVVDGTVGAGGLCITARFENQAEPMPALGASDKCDEETLRLELRDGEVRKNAVGGGGER